MSWIKNQIVDKSVYSFQSKFVPTLAKFPILSSYTRRIGFIKVSNYWILVRNITPDPLRSGKLPHAVWCEEYYPTLILVGNIYPGRFSWRILSQTGINIFFWFTAVWNAALFHVFHNILKFYCLVKKSINYWVNFIRKTQFLLTR